MTQSIHRRKLSAPLNVALVASLLIGAVAVADPPASIFAPKAKAKPKAAAKAPAALRPGKPAAQPGSVPKSDNSKPQYVMRLNVQPKPGQTLEAAYFDYFSKNRVYPRVIRAKVRQLINNGKNKKRFDEVIAIIRSAIRAGQIQPWMYEALAISMEIAKLPSDEIERTLMSAADFASTPAELLYLASYLERFGFKRRSLDLLEGVSAQAPHRAEPYIHGLELAKDLKDDDAIIWAATGILERAWPMQERVVRDKARYAAVNTLKRLKQRDKERAKQYKQEIKKALERDVVVRISWAGEADVDMMVEEPSGSVCSYRNVRTTAGGVLVGDSNTKLDRSAGKGYSENYVCPQGFSGTYRVLLRQVWGKIPSGKVTVDVWQHGATEKVTHMHKVVPISEQKGAMVVFELANGRRKESLKDHQMANDIATQVAANRAILAQQLNAVANAQVPTSLGQQVGFQEQTPFVTSTTPVTDRFGRTVGFRPEISIIPTGATMSVTAVISADRRYVRITALPFFSGITAVVQFNLATGVTGIDVDLAGIDVDIGLDRDLDTDLDVGVDA